MFSKKLKDLRQEKNLTQEELANLIFVSRSAIAKWEQGKGLPNKNSLQDLAKFFNVNIKDLFNDDDPHVIIENIEISSKKNKKNLLMIFSLITIAIFIISTIIIASIKNNNEYGIIKENEFFSEEKLWDFGLLNLEKIHGEQSYTYNSAFYTQIEEYEAFEEYVKYIFNYLKSSPYISYISFAIDRPEEAYHTISRNQYLFQSDFVEDFRDSNGMRYDFYYFTSLDKNRNYKDNVACHRISLHYQELHSSWLETAEGKKYFHNFSMSLIKCGSQDDYYKYYLANEFYDIEEENINNENFSSYFNNIGLQRSYPYYYLMLNPVNYFSKGSIEIDLEITLIKSNNNVLETNIVTRKMFITSCYDWSTYESFHAEEFGYENFDNLVSIAITSININANSKLYFVKKIN